MRVNPKIKKVNPVNSITLGNPPKIIPLEITEIDNKTIFFLLVKAPLCIKIMAEIPIKIGMVIARAIKYQFSK